MVFDSYLSVKTSFILLIFVDLSPQSIETDETAKKPDLVKMPISSEEEREAISQLEEAISTENVTAGKQLNSGKSQQICNWTSRWLLHFKCETWSGMELNPLKQWE